MQIRIADLASLTEYPGNPRTHPEQNRAAIHASLTEFGQVLPLIVWKGVNQVVDGNGRFGVMREMGWTQAYVYDIELTESRAAALVIAMNRSGDLAGWNAQALYGLLQKIESTEMSALEPMVLTDIIDLKKLEALQPIEPVSGEQTEVRFMAGAGGDTPKPTPATTAPDVATVVPWVCTLSVEQREYVVARLTKLQNSLGFEATIGDALHALCSIELQF